MYVGTREPLKKMMSEFSKSKGLFDRQIIDLGGFHDLNLEYLKNNLNLNQNTIILSNLRNNINDELGALESGVLKEFNRSILFRTTPLDIGIEIHRKWAQYYNVLLTSFHKEGVMWLNTDDLIEACFLPLDIINTRLGMAFDLTGPKKYSMAELRDIFEEDLNTSIEIADLDEEIVLSILVKSGMPIDQAKWLVRYQIESSNPRLRENENIGNMLQRQPQTPDFKRNILGE